MKYIKKFNEELKSSTYRSAGDKLLYYNKKKRAANLLDFADEKDYGVYNVWSHIKNYGTRLLKFTNPSLNAIYYGDKKTDPETLVKDWVEGTGKLSIIFEFGFNPLQSQLDNIPSVNSKWVKLNLFSIELLLSEWEFGLKEFDSESKWQAEHENYEFVPTTLFDFFDYTKELELYLKKPFSEVQAHLIEASIFADRQSALRFKRWLLSIFDEKLKDSIMEVLSIVGADSFNIESIIYSFNNLRIHGLYSEEMNNSKPSSFFSTYYDKRIS